ncbi:MAG: NAD(P)H-dependent glycerol-3-phosphate dehydrogenase [Phycisphaerae bacterium]
MKKERMGVIGDGAMGTLCAVIIGAAGFPVQLWGRDAVKIADLARTRENTRYLPGIKLSTEIRFTADLDEIIANCDALICAVPTQHIRLVLQRSARNPATSMPVISVAKGIENSTLLCPTEIISDRWPQVRTGCISGPAIAHEIAAGLPATIVAASAHDDILALMHRLFTTSSLRVYSNTDVRGVELAGATKNIIAIAAGILDGMEAGTNAKASLMTRGLVEISRLGIAMGSQAETFSGLAGMGDLITTCFAPEGRNRCFGQLIGSGISASDALARSRGVVEGMPTTRSVVDLARRLGIEMPISQGLYEVLFFGKSPRDAIASLMSRQPRHEGISGPQHPAPPAANA